MEKGGLSPLILVTLIGLDVLMLSLFLSKVYAAHILLLLAFKKEEVILQFLSVLLIQTNQTAGLLWKKKKALIMTKTYDFLHRTER